MFGGSGRKNREKIDKLGMEVEMIRRDMNELSNLVATIANLVSGLYVNLKNEKEEKERVDKEN